MLVSVTVIVNLNIYVTAQEVKECSCHKISNVAVETFTSHNFPKFCQTEIYSIDIKLQKCSCSWNNNNNGNDDD
jgi:hypothetical protein